MNLRRLIAEVAHDRIVILATHVISDVELIADKIVVLKEGSVIAIKNQEELILNTHVFETFTDYEIIKNDDDTAKFVSAMFTSRGLKVRYVSKKTHDNKVQTTLDDVYIDLLG